MRHVSVLRADVQKYLSLKKVEIVVDGTLGLGGHAEDILKAIGKEGKLIAFEQDERNLSSAREFLKKYESQIVYIHDNFCYLKNRLEEVGVQKVDAILLDLGLSSPHIDDETRGFSFLRSGPLDMRFDLRNKKTAEYVVNNYEEEKLVKIFFEYGEEKFASKIAREICRYRKSVPFTETTELADFISDIVPKKFVKRGIHPATKVFQALRIEVNDELNVLKDVLRQAKDVLKVGGRIVVISYHSLEDRIVKQFFKALERPEPSEEEKVYQTYGEPIFERLTKKPVTPGEEEISENIRSRSAKLRAYRKIRETD